MKKLLPFSKIYVSSSKIAKAGRGVFASKNIKQGELVEKCPVIETPAKDFHYLGKTELKNYYFMWIRGKFKKKNVLSKKIKIKNKKASIALGFGSIYNHSYNPNATYEKRLTEGVIDFIAIKPIKKGEEITVNYNFGVPDNQNRLWIKSIKPDK